MENLYGGNEERGSYDVPIRRYIDREGILFDLFERVAATLTSRESLGTAHIDDTVRSTKLYTPLDVRYSPRGLRGLWQVVLSEVRLTVPDRYVSVQQKVTVVPDISTAAHTLEQGGIYKRPMWRLKNGTSETKVPAHEPRRLHTERHVLEPRQMACGAWLNIAAQEVGVELAPEFILPPLPRS